MISRSRLWFLLRLALIPAGLIILFFSGIFPLEDLLSYSTQNLTASVAAYDVASLTNEQRVQNGLAPLAVSALLTEAAKEKANDMAQNSYYAHVSPDGKTPLYWLERVGYKYLNAGENLIIDRTTSEQAVDAWMHSADHRENILRPQFTEIGIGVAKGEFEGVNTIFVVQEFGTPYPGTRIVSIATKPISKVEKEKTSEIEVSTVAQPVVSKPAVVPITISIPSVAKLVSPNIAKILPNIPSKTAPVVISTTSSTTLSIGQGTTSVSYALAPEFYKSVTLTKSESIQNEKEPADPQAASESKLSIVFAQIKAFMAHLFNI